MSLREHLPSEATDGSYDGQPFMKHLDEKVVSAHRGQPWPGSHRNVAVWWKLENGLAVGWNENKSVGWSFPVIRCRQ